MCGVVGYIGDKSSCAYVLEGLTRLEYRGYDSAGYACVDKSSGGLLCVKAVGSIENLVIKLAQYPIDGCVGIGHTRWATHGVSTETNAHPHFNTDRTISVVHNGIIENYDELRSRLKQFGHFFYSDTDSEVIAHLLEASLVQEQTLQRAVLAVVRQLEGAYSCAVMFKQFPDLLLVIRKRSPMCIGVGYNEMFIASDIAAFADQTKRVVFLPDESFAIVKRGGLEVYDFSGSSIQTRVQEIDPRWGLVGKDGYEHFMLKEMYEQKRVIADTVAWCNSQGVEQIYASCGLTQETLCKMRAITFCACGTSSYAADIASHFFEHIAMTQASSHLASEFRHRPFFADPNNLFCVLSQSGETADTLEALRMVNGTGTHTLAITNVMMSSMAREASGTLLTQAQREIAVASTKSFTAQVSLLYWLAHAFACGKGLITKEQLGECERDLLLAGEVLDATMERYKFDIAALIAPQYAKYHQFIFLGRHVSFPLAREAALKLKEISYRFTDTCPAGELKHGPLALIDASIPVFLFSVLDPAIYQKLVVNAQEIKARSGHLVVFAFEGQEQLIRLADTVFIIPHVAPLLAPLAMTGVMQLLVYQIARELGCPIDKPRNLAKSVTVE